MTDADKKSLREQYDSLFVPLYAPAPPLFVSAKGARITADDDDSANADRMPNEDDGD